MLRENTFEQTIELSEGIGGMDLEEALPMLKESMFKRIIEFAGRLEGIDIDVLGEALEIGRLHRQVEQIVENDIMAARGLNAQQVDIMEYLYHNSECIITPADLADETGLIRSAMTGALDSLEGRGYTVRSPHPSDRRVIVVSLTPTGREAASQLLPERYWKLHTVASALSGRECGELMRIYRKVLDVIVRDITNGRI